MKVIFHITILFCILLIISQAYSFNTDASKYSMTCHENGRIEISSPDIINQYNAYKVKINAAGPGGETFDVTGTWKDGYFTSEEALFNESGEYLITIEFQSQEDKTEKTIDCPGLVFSCRLFSIGISRCYNYENAFYAIFDAGNTGNLDLQSNMTYTASDDRGQSTQLDPKDRINPAQISGLGPDTYQLRWQTDRNIELFHIRAPVCNSVASKICTEKEECTLEEECLEFEYCDIYCKRLDCNGEEIAKDHRCVSSCTKDGECDDSLSCTQDQCIGNVCAHEPVICKSEDICTTAKCMEPTGCTYTVDEQCRESESEKDKDAEGNEKPEPSATCSCGAIMTAMSLIILALLSYILKLKKPKKSRSK